LIKERSSSNNQWLEFNDIDIREFNIKDLKEEAFGYDLSQKNMNKYKNAYILIYDKIRSKKYSYEIDI
jgi:hypothetical protein